MNPNLVRMLLFNSRRAGVRICAIIAGIAVGMAGLLLLVGAFEGLQARDAREAWLDAGTPAGASDGKGSRAAAPEDGGTPGDGQVLVRHKVDRVGDKDVAVVQVAAGSAPSARIPGVPTLPVPGTYVPSPALAALIERDGGQLVQRYGHRQAGILPQSSLSSPDSLIAVVGVESGVLSASEQAQTVTSFVVPRASQLTANDAVRTIVALGAIGVLLPVMLLVSVVTQLGLSERQEALSTLRLIGAPPAIVGRIAVVEAALTGVVGSLLGVGIATLARPWAARVRVDRGSFYPSDLALPPVVVALCCLLLVAAVVASAARRAHRSRIGPTGISRQRAEPEPTLWRVVPLAAGVLVLALLPTGIRRGWVAEGLPTSLIMIAGFLATSLGVMVAGPCITYVAGARATRATGSAAGLIAAGRVTTAPRATFRSVSGLVVAAFMVSVFAVAASAGAPDRAEAGPGKLPLDALAMRLPGQPGELAHLVDALTAQPGVSAVAIAYAPKGASSSADTWILGTPEAVSLGLNPADESAPYQAISSNSYLSASAAQEARSAATQSGTLGSPAALVVRTDGSREALERARTAMEVALPQADVPLTRAESVGRTQNQVIAQLYSIAGIGVFIAVVVAGCTLAISTVAAILDRRRLLGMLRLMGTPVGSIRRSIAYEAAIPLIVTLAGSIGLGFGVAWFIVTSLSSARPTAPSAQYFLALGAGLLLAVTFIAVSLTAVRPSTGSATTRYE